MGSSSRRLPAEDLSTLLQLAKQRRIQPLVSQVLPLTEAVAAHTVMESGAFTGKIVLRCQEVN